MTKEKAIEILENVSWSGYDDEEIAEAVQMGAEALKEKRPQGEFDLYKDDYYSGGGYILCTACKYRFSFGAYKILENDNYCPHCGAKIIRRPDPNIKTFTFNICMKENEIT